jgi:hypothetical protein
VTYLEKIEVMRGIDDEILNVILAMYDRVEKEMNRLRPTQFQEHYNWSRQRRACLIDLLMDIYRTIWGD